MKCARLRRAFYFCALLSAYTGQAPWSEVQAQAGTPARTADPAAAAALDAARAAFEALSEADRKAVQENLIWSGDYSGAADGTFGRQTFDAISAYQTRNGRQATGTLSAADRSALQANARNIRSSVGFDIVTDARTGVQIGVPLKLLPKQGDNPNGGTRWQSQDGKITLDTRVAPPDSTLQSLYDRNVAIKTPGRIVSYKVLKADFFVIAGETPTGKFYSRYAGGPPGIRAFSIGYDKSVAAQLDRLVVAIANAFVPFPSSAAPAVASTAVTPPAQPSAVVSGQPPFGTGLAVAPRQVFTAAPVGQCKDLRVGGLKVQQVKGKGPFLLETAQDLNAKQVPLAADTSVEAGQRAVVLAFNNDGNGPQLVTVAGTLADGSMITAALQPGADGAPIFGQNGALVGLVQPLPANPRKIAGIIPSAPYPMVSSAALNDAFPGFIQSRTNTAAPVLSAADLVNVVKASVVPIICSP
ncbi:peptidoglycan-binding domain-containing protein [Microvirga rosea]|uniref:peptidoglycan-binding domain-containing protein n=1 Tax=Microvirga rosea TaxID=2715425 RepID=UPI001D0B4476|nr:peptidoglycan-binding domain-containing protein [Microvirga rosea]MCB8822784.1 serine protease [Microvirga rosea]